MLSILKWLQEMRTPALDNFFIAITVLGEEYLAIIVLAAILWCTDKKFGYRLGIIYLSSILINLCIKDITRIPRPFIVDKHIIPIRPETATGFSFPSAHTQGIATLTTSLMLKVQKNWIYLAGAVLIVLMATSRMYLGVHTLLDVLSGAIIGIGWVLIGGKLFDYIEDTGRNDMLLLVLLPPLVGLYFFQNPDYYKVAGTFTAILTGYILDSKYIRYEVKGSLAQRISKLAIGMMGVVALKTGGKIVFGASLSADFTRYFLLGIWLTVLAPILFKRIYERSIDQGIAHNKEQGV